MLTADGQALGRKQPEQLLVVNIAPSSKARSPVRSVLVYY